MPIKYLYAMLVKEIFNDWRIKRKKNSPFIDAHKLGDKGFQVKNDFLFQN